jgi:hypothetical protein
VNSHKQLSEGGGLFICPLGGDILSIVAQQDLIWLCEKSNGNRWMIRFDGKFGDTNQNIKCIKETVNA